MLKISLPKDLSSLRRIALSNQGLLQSNPFGKGLKGVSNAIEHIGYVQIDTISVVERAHNHVLFSRVPNYKPDMLNQLLIKGDIFEYWSHAAAFLPIEDFRFSLPYKHAIKSGQVHWYKNPDKKLMKEVLARIKSEGSLRSRDLDSKNTKASGWWDWKPAKKALEQLYMQGDLMVASREGFQKVYDLTERVIGSDIDTKIPSAEEFANHLVEQQLKCHGLVSLKGFTYLRKNSELRKAIKCLVNEKLALGELEQVKLDSGDAYLVEKGALEQRLPRLTNRVLILSPFDNCTIQRERLRSIFKFDYQIECYLPEAKRKFGYFSLPLLYGDQFIGRMDCKAHRKDRLFEIKSLHLESKNLDDDRFISSFSKAVREFSQFQNCDSIVLRKVYPEELIKTYQEALESS